MSTKQKWLGTIRSGPFSRGLRLTAAYAWPTPYIRPGALPFSQLQPGQLALKGF